jgi:uncharacterized membrane protein YqjE
MPNQRGRRAATVQGVAPTTMSIIRTLGRLAATEFRLLRAELNDKIGALGLAIGLATGGAVLLITAVILLFVAAISALMDQGFGLTSATLIVFGVVVITGSGCLWFGIRQLRTENLLPNKTIAQVQKDFESIAPETN